MTLRNRALFIILDIVLQHLFSSSSHPSTPLVSRTFVGAAQSSPNPVKPDLVLLHGWGLNSGAWHSVVEPLSQHFIVHTIDLPGFGTNAEHIPHSYDLDALSSWLAPCIPPGAILLGWSMGGLIAQHLASQSRADLQALITVASTPCFPQKDDWHGIRPEVLAAFEKQLEVDFDKTLSRFLAIQAMGSPSAKADIKLIQQDIRQYSAPSELALMDGLSLLSSVDLRQQIASIRVPTLRIYGRLDSLVPVDGIDKISKMQPSAEHVVIAHAAHAPFVSHPQEWLSAITDFVQKAIPESY